MIRKILSDVITEAEDDIEKGKGIVHVASNYDDTSQVFIYLFFHYLFQSLIRERCIRSKTKRERGGRILSMKEVCYFHE